MLITDQVATVSTISMRVAPGEGEHLFVQSQDETWTGLQLVAFVIMTRAG
jgi:hypothetical protein